MEDARVETNLFSRNSEAYTLYYKEIDNKIITMVTCTPSADNTEVATKLLHYIILRQVC